MKSYHKFNLLYQTTRCAFKAQEKNSALGLLWHFLNPLAMTVVLYVVFSSIRQFGEIPNFGLFILMGIIHFNFFSHVTVRAAEGMLNHRGMILNTTVPREILVFRFICLEGVTYVIELMLVIVLIALFGNGLSWNALYYIFIAACMILLTSGFSFMLASGVVFLTDLTYIWGVVSLLLFFLTPIFYSREMIAQPLVHKLITYNPLAQIVILGRKCLLYGLPLDPGEIMLVFAGPTASALMGWFVFIILKDHIADYI